MDHVPQERKGVSGAQLSRSQAETVPVWIHGNDEGGRAARMLKRDRFEASECTVDGYVKESF